MGQIARFALAAAVVALSASAQAEKGGETVGPLTTREAFFASLDYSVPGLADVRRCVDGRDYEAASRALLDYMRRRGNVKYHVNSWDSHSPKPGYDTSVADDVLAGVARGMLVDWYRRYQFQGKIDWSAIPYNDREWHWGLNRHDQWRYLAEAYWATGDEKYAKRFVEELTDWVTNCPVVTDGKHNSSAAWRTIEAGIRMSSQWPATYQRFLTSPSFTPEANVLFLTSVLEHARHLMAHPTGGNWLTMEMNGLLHAGVLFPEFAEAGQWRKTALDRLGKELDTQVYPDGMQFELSTGYHRVALGNFLAPAKLCALNGIALPDGYLPRLERMYDAIMHLSKPSGFMPATNDSDSAIESIPGTGKWADGRPDLKDAAARYNREDLLYVATCGKEGTLPDGTSHVFPYAGFYLMRQGWTPDSLYLLFDAGPFGAGHQHEDKLSFEAYAYGETLLCDPGRFSYAHKVFHPYALSTAAHNTALVDGKGQARRAQKPEDRGWIVSKPLGNPWISSLAFDYAEGVYDDGYGSELDKSVTHRRSIVFVKNDYWLIVDRFEGSGVHTVNTLFHFAPGKVERGDADLRCWSANGKRPNLLIVPAQARDLSLSVIEGRESPCQGWISTEYNKWLPAPVADYACTGPLPVEFAYLLLPSKPGAKPVGSIERIDLTVDGKSAPPRASAYTVRLGDGRVDHVLIAHGIAGEKQFAGISTEAEVEVVRARLGRGAWYNGEGDERGNAVPAR